LGATPGVTDGTGLSEAQFAELIEACCQLDRRDAGVYAAIRRCFRKPPAHPELAIGFSQQQQQTSIGGLVATGKIDCEFLAAHRWQVEGKQRIVGRGSFGAGLMREATCSNGESLRVGRFSPQSPGRFKSNALHEDVQVLQLHSAFDAIAQLHGGTHVALLL